MDPQKLILDYLIKQSKGESVMVDEVDIIDYVKPFGVGPGQVETALDAMARRGVIARTSDCVALLTRRG